MLDGTSKHVRQLAPSEEQVFVDIPPHGESPPSISIVMDERDELRVVV